MNVAILQCLLFLESLFDELVELKTNRLTELVVIVWSGDTLALFSPPKNNIVSVESGALPNKAQFLRLKPL